VASVGPLAETEKVAGKEGRAQDIGGDVTEGEESVRERECGGLWVCGCVRREKCSKRKAESQPRGFAAKKRWGNYDNRSTL
jgi:hypothetical protein